MRRQPLKYTPNDPGKLGPIGPFRPLLGTGGAGPTTDATGGYQNPACANVVDFFNEMGCDIAIDYPEGSPCHTYQQIINNLGCDVYL